MKIFAINLKNDIVRKRHMQELCQKYNLQVEFIEAVNGRDLKKEDITHIYSSERTIKALGRELSRGEIGCALSHKTIYKKILHDNIEIALILEDDITFNEDLLALLDLKNEFQKNWELVLLGHHTGYSREIDTAASIWSQIQLTEKYKLTRPCEKGYGTYGYLITKKGSKKLLQHLETIVKPIDHYTGDSRYINLYTINPAPIRIYEELSENDNSMQERQSLKYRQSELFSLKNLISTFIQKYHFLNFSKKNIRNIIFSVMPLKSYR